RRPMSAGRRPRRRSVREPNGAHAARISRQPRRAACNTAPLFRRRTRMEKTAEQRRGRLACAALAGALALAAGGALAQAKKPAAQRAPVVLAINEGATTQVTPEELFERYTGLARSVERALGRPVKLEVYPDTARFRAELEHRRFDVVFGKTVNLLAGMIRDK